MRVYIGIDAGGSKTRALALAEDGSQRADLEIGGADLPTLGAAAVENALRTLRGQLEASLHPTDDVAGVALGLPGFTEAEVWDAALTDIAGRVFAGWPHRLYNDVRLALAGAFAGAPGILVLSGTGSMAWGKRPDGTEARTGGWGPLFGDEGSAYAIGIAALRAACWALDGRGPPTSLTERLLAVLGAASLGEVLEHFSRAEAQPSSRARIASLARTVDGEVQRGDAVALGLLEQAASELVRHVEALSERLELDNPPLAYAGGSFASPVLRRVFSEQLCSRGFAAPTAPLHPPAFGGVLLAGYPSAFYDYEQPSDDYGAVDL
jgi:N-acetylglucosamine kinase-like BadF-type ATPase